MSASNEAHGHAPGVQGLEIEAPAVVLDLEDDLSGLFASAERDDAGRSACRARRARRPASIPCTTALRTRCSIGVKSASAMVLSKLTASPRVTTRTSLPSRSAASRTGSLRRVNTNSSGTMRARVTSLWMPLTMLPKTSESSANPASSRTSCPFISFTSLVISARLRRKDVDVVVAIELQIREGCPAAPRGRLSPAALAMVTVDIAGHGASLAERGEFVVLAEAIDRVEETPAAASQLLLQPAKDAHARHQARAADHQLAGQVHQRIEPFGRHPDVLAVSAILRCVGGAPGRPPL